MMPDDNSKLVYSTGHEVPRKEKQNRNTEKSEVLPGQQRVIIRLDRKSRGGKSVTVIDGLRMSLKERETLLKELKTRLGTGGTLRDTSIEIQGDHCDTLTAALEKMGFRPKRSGG